MARHVILHLLWWLGVPIRLVLTAFVVIPLLIWPQQYMEFLNMVRDLWKRPL